MKIGETVYFERERKVTHGKIIAIDGDPNDPSGVVVQNGQSIHWLMQNDVHANRSAAGCALLTRLRRDRTDAIRRAHEAAGKVEELDQLITETIRAFK